MGTHVKVLGALFIALALFGLIGAVALAAGFGGLAALVSNAASSEDAAAAPFLGLIGLITASITTVLAIPGLIAGLGLIGFRPWARVLAIVLSAISLLGFPLGTALGLYGLWVLLSRETESLFAHRSTGGNPA